MFCRSLRALASKSSGTNATYQARPPRKKPKQFNVFLDTPVSGSSSSLGGAGVSSSNSFGKKEIIVEQRCRYDNKYFVRKPKYLSGLNTRMNRKTYSIYATKKGVVSVKDMTVPTTFNTFLTRRIDDYDGSKGRSNNSASDSSNSTCGGNIIKESYDSNVNKRELFFNNTCANVNIANNSKGLNNSLNNFIGGSINLAAGTSVNTCNGTFLPFRQKIINVDPDIQKVWRCKCIRKEFESRVNGIKSSNLNIHCEPYKYERFDVLHPNWRENSFPMLSLISEHEKDKLRKSEEREGQRLLYSPYPNSDSSNSPENSSSPSTSSLSAVKKLSTDELKSLKRSSLYKSSLNSIKMTSLYPDPCAFSRGLF